MMSEVFGKKDRQTLEVLREDFMLDSQVRSHFYLYCGMIMYKDLEDEYTD